PLVVTLVRNESCFFDAVWIHLHVPVAPRYVKLGEELGPVETIDDVVYPWDGHLVRDSDRVQASKIDDEPNGAITFWNTHHWECVRAGTRPDQTLLDQLVDLLL